MPIEIKMPQLGESVTEGTVSRWLKQVGETVKQYEPILEVTTDKVDTEVPAPAAGTLVEIIVPEGDTVPVGTVIARLGNGEEPAERVEPEAKKAGAARAAQPQPRAAQTAPAQTAPPISPVVARLIAEHGLDIGQITGTGGGGRVSKQDVLRFLDARAATSTTIETQAAPAVPQPQTAPPTPAVQAYPDDVEVVPLSPMRRAIAEHMERSVRTAPHVTTVFEIDMSRVAAHREQSKAEFERQGVRLTYTSYFVQAVAQALQSVPVLNGRFSEQGIVLNKHIHIGVAVALDEGLLVPVIRDADEKSLLGLARAVNDLSERARTRRLKPDETQGGTFTITNHGTSGSILGTPIINQPQSGILGVGAIVKRPAVVTHNGIDALAIKPICYLSLTFDHRVCDGATADAFLAVIQRVLEGYSEL